MNNYYIRWWPPAIALLLTIVAIIYQNRPLPPEPCGSETEVRIVVGEGTECVSTEIFMQ